MTVGAATMLLASISALAIVQQSWQRSKATLADDMALQAQVEESGAELAFDSTGALRLGTQTGQRFAIAFDSTGQSMAAAGNISASDIALVSAQLDASTLTPDSTASATIDLEDGHSWTAVAVPCERPKVCSFFAIGRTQASFGSYLVGRLGWMALIAVVLTGLTVLAARWVVGRSLRPVDRMRRELDEIAATDRKQPQLPSRPGCRQRRGLPGWVAWPNVRLLRHDGRLHRRPHRLVLFNRHLRGPLAGTTARHP